MNSALKPTPSRPTPPTLTRIDAEIARRNRVPKSPAALALRISNGHWQIADHLELLDRKLVELTERKIRRLLVTLPPRHGKSQLCSRYFPAWYLGKHPNHRVILTSYAATIAADFGGRVRDILKRWGDELFGVRVRADQTARDNWNIDGHEGGMQTAGVGGGITGRGANLFLIDDPVRNSRDAASETYQKHTWEWWTSTAFTRLEPDGVVLLIMTRWNAADLAGRLIKQDEEGDGDDAEKWHVINLPAIAEENDALGRKPGEALWPDRWPLKKLLARMKRLGSYVWAALFQQRPAPLEGNYFKREWFKIVTADRVPKLPRLCRCWDLAATAAEEGGDPDWLVGAKVGRSEDGRYFVVDIHRERTGPAGVMAAIMQHAHSDGKQCKIRIEQEGAASGKLIKHHYLRLLDGFDAQFTPIPRASKFVRAGPFNAACQRGDVHLVAGPWNEAWIEEMVVFPNGTHDDQPDATVGSYEAVASDFDSWSPTDLSRVLDYPDEP